MKRNVQHRAVRQTTILLALPWPGCAAAIEMAERVAAKYADELEMSFRKGQEAMVKPEEYKRFCVPATEVNGSLRMEGICPSEATLNNALRESGLCLN